MALLRPVKRKTKAEAKFHASMLESGVPLPDPAYVPLYGMIETTILKGEETKDDNGSYIAYLIKVNYQGQEWQVARRFKMFEKLQAMLQSYVMGRQRLPDLPKTHILWRGLSPDYVKGKAAKLDAYLKALLQIPEVTNSQEMYNFLFKNRYVVGGRASFLGVPESKPIGVPQSRTVERQAMLADSPTASPDRSPNQFDSFNSPSAGYSGVSSVGSLGFVDKEVIQRVAPAGSELASWLEFNKAEIEEHEACIRRLKEERDAKIKDALKATGETSPRSTLFGSSPPATVFGRMDSVSEEDPPVLRASEETRAMVSAFGDSQDIECCAYGTTAAAVAALNRGFILVTFTKTAKKGNVGTELSVKLAEPISTPTPETLLTGTVQLDGEVLAFEGSLQLSELKGTGLLRAAAA